MNVSELPSPREPYIAHPPIPAAPFVNRRAELRILRDWARNAVSKPMLAIVGIGGVGKTSLAWEWFNKQSKEVGGFEGRMWWSFYNENSGRFFAHCHSYLTGTSVADSQAISTRELALRIIDRLQEDRFLLVLDGIEREMVAYSAASQVDTASVATSHQIRRIASLDVSTFIRQCATIESASKVILTSRLALADLEDSNGEPNAGVAVLQLGGLDEDSTRHLFSQLSIGPSDELIELARVSQFHPLVVRMIGQLMATDPSLLDQMKIALQSGSSMERRGVATTILGNAIDGLRPEARKILNYLATLKDPVSYSILAGLLVGKGKDFSRESELDQALGLLQDLGLIAWNQEDNTYFMHPLVRGVIWETVLDSADHKK
jgi:NB-ARC domain